MTPVIIDSAIRIMLSAGTSGTLLAMTIVIAALLLVSICVQIASLSAARAGRKAPAGAAAVPSAPAVSPLPSAAPSHPDEALVAVITAAIAAAMDSDPAHTAPAAGFRVRRIRRLG